VNNLQDLSVRPENQGAAISPERVNLLKDTFSAALDTAHGLQRLNEQQVNQLMSGLVRAKLLNADDSYKLQDLILNFSHFDRTIEKRVEEALRSRGIVTESAYQELQARLGRLETRVAQA